MTWPTGRTLVHVLISGLPAQGLLFTCLYIALMHGAPAVLVSLVSVAAGGVYQQKFCRGIDFRATAALQNAACVVPVVVLAALMPLTVTNPWRAATAVAAVACRLCRYSNVCSSHVGGSGTGGDENPARRL